jgi:hypothetical protein
MLKFTVCHLISSLFLVVSVLAQTPANFCESPETKAFDFQIGIWQSEDGKQIHEIRKTLDNCAIRETWKTDGKESAYGFKSFDNGLHDKNGEKKWFYSWFAPGFHQLWEGRRENGQWRFYREWWLNGEPIISRTYWNSLSDESLERIVEQSRDGGKTWRIHVKHKFVKKPATAAGK